jgi:hypothetical protein
MPTVIQPLRELPEPLKMGHRRDAVYIQTRYITCNKNMFGPFSINLAKLRPQLFPAPKNFIGPFCVLRPNFGPLSKLGHTFLDKG